MKKLLTFAALLSFGAAEASILGSLANSALQGITMRNNYNNGYGANGTNNYGMNNYGTYNMGSNGAMYNNGMNNYGTAYNNGMNNSTAAVPIILNNMYQQATMIQNNYKSDSNIVTYTSNLGNALILCRQYQNPSQVVNQLPTILQYVLGIYNALNQYNAGANARNLISGFSQLLFVSTGMNQTNFGTRRYSGVAL